jgi:hypothetical protein
MNIASLVIGYLGISRNRENDTAPLEISLTLSYISGAAKIASFLY